jgi:hypothetical protein
VNLLEKQFESGKIGLILSDPERTVDIHMGKDLSCPQTTNEKKPFFESFLPDLPRDKPCRALRCQGFCQRAMSVVLPMPGLPVRRRLVWRGMGIRDCGGVEGKSGVCLRCDMKRIGVDSPG